MFKKKLKQTIEEDVHKKKSRNWLGNKITKLKYNKIKI